MFNWLRELLEIRAEYQGLKKDIQHCESCETLKTQLSIANQEKKALLDRILEKPEPIPTPDDIELKPIYPRGVSWNTRRQMLETESREAAKLLRQKKEEGPDRITIEELEKELDIVEKERDHAI